MEDKCREEFEDWYSKNFGMESFLFGYGAYHSRTIQGRWEAWQAAYNRKQPDSGWNSNMSAAPRDGTKILTYSKKQGVQILVFTQWIAAGRGNRWVKYKGDKGRWKPTHWMPLPQPPLEKDKI